MSQLLLWVAIADLTLACVMNLQLLWAKLHIYSLRNWPQTSERTMWPRVSIVVAARDEERNIREGVQSLLRQDYPDFELIVVNDRSTDGTSKILDELADVDNKLQIVTVTELPPKWLGKNHAMSLGSEQAEGELLLFSDADIVMADDAVRRAVDYLLANDRDHVTLVPDPTVPGSLLNCCVAIFSNFFLTLFRPWKAKDAKSKCFVGIGAFNLLRHDVYKAIGGHEPIAMRPDDDVKLGKLVKTNGYSQELVHGGGLIRVEWYSSVWELIVGLEKNSFAAIGYRVWVVILTTFLLLAVHLWPFAGVFLASGAARWLYLATIVVFVAATAENVREMGANVLCCLWFPVGIIIFLFIAWRSMLMTLINGGIRWRGTLYPLSDLKANDF